MDKIINLLINNWTKGVDTYTHNGSTWLIFTEQKSWVIELTESKTLWYNYNFFKDLFSLVSMDVVDNQYYITKWVEDNIINGVNHTNWGSTMNERFIGDVIESGVKENSLTFVKRQMDCEDTIQNGVKSTYFHELKSVWQVEDIIQNGVKETIELMNELPNRVKKIIKKGVKETKGHGFEQQNIIDDIVKDGVKETNHIKNNVRETKQFEEHLGNTIDEVINEGVKETKTPGKDGDIMSTVEWMLENNSTSYPKMIDDVIENGEKINGTYVGGKRQKENIEVVIDYGVKETKSIGKESPNYPKVIINHIIQNGTKNPSV